jgi:hypothetical protein
MYTEIDLSEFSIRLRLKLGDLAVDMSNKLQYGDNVNDIIEDTAVIRIFLNSLNSALNDWTVQEKQKRMEYFTSKYKLVNKPIYPIDFLDRFKPPATEIVTGNSYTKIPNGVGTMYATNGVITLYGDPKLTLTDLSS